MVYQIYPRSFADSDGDGIGDLRGIIEHARPPRPRSASTSSGCRRSTRRRRTTTATTSATTSDIDPLFGTLADFDELLDALHARGMKLVMDLVVNHTSDEHPWFVESRSSRGQPEARLVLVARRAAGHDPGAPGAEPTNWGSFFSGPAWELDEATGRVLPAPVLPQAARPQLGEPRGPRGGLRDDALVAGPGRRRLPHGRHQHDLQGRRRCPTAPRSPGLAVRATGAPYFICGPRIHEFLQEMHREVFAGRDGARC